MASFQKRNLHIRRDVLKKCRRVRPRTASTFARFFMTSITIMNISAANFQQAPLACLIPSWFSPSSDHIIDGLRHEGVLSDRQAHPTNTSTRALNNHRTDIPAAHAARPAIRTTITMGSQEAKVIKGDSSCGKIERHSSRRDITKDSAQ